MFVYIYFHVCILSIFSAVCVPVLLVCVPLPALSCFAQVCHFLIPQWGAPGLGQVLNISCASTSREWGLLVLMPLSLGFCSVVFQLSVFFGCSDLLSSFKNTFCGWFLSVIKFCSSHRDRTFSNLVFFFFQLTELSLIMNWILMLLSSRGQHTMGRRLLSWAC